MQRKTLYMIKLFKIFYIYEERLLNIRDKVFVNVDIEINTIQLAIHPFIYR